MDPAPADTDKTTCPVGSPTGGPGLAARRPDADRPLVELDPTRRLLWMASALLMLFVGPFLGSAISLAVPDIESFFSVSASAVGWVITMYALVTATASVPCGKLADTFGRKVFFIGGGVLIAVGSIACAIVPTFSLLIACRAFQSVGSAMLTAATMPICMSVFAPSRRGSTLGICTAAIYVGGALGPVVGGFLNAAFGWQSIFWVVAGLVVVALALGAFTCPPDAVGRVVAPAAGARGSGTGARGLGVGAPVPCAGAHVVGAGVRALTSGVGASTSGHALSGRLDTKGNLLYMPTIVLTMYGMTELGTLSFAWAFIVAGLAFGVAFVMVENHASDPIIRFTMFTKDRVFTLSCLAALMNYGATSALTYLMSIHLQSIMGFDSQMAGFIMMSQPVLMALISPVAGSVSDRFNPGMMASVGMVFCAAGLAVLAFVGQATPVWVVIAALVSTGIGFGLFSSPNTNVIMSRVSAAEYGVANTILTTMRTVGQTASMAVVTIIVSVTLGDLSLTQAGTAQLVDVMHVSFALFTVMCLLGVVFSLARGKGSGKGA